MRRREFITLLGSAVAWPLSLRAQGRERIHGLGILMSLAANDPEGQAQSAGLIEGMGQLGWHEGRNLRIEHRWAGGDGERLRAYAAELAALRPDVIVLNGTPALTALRQQTQTIPVVFVNVSEPVNSGFVESLARPGGQTTGFTNYESSMAGKWLGFLKEIMPSMTRSVVIFNSGNSTHKDQLQAIEAVASSAGVRVSQLDISLGSDLEAAVDNFAREGTGGLVVLADFQTTTYRDRIIASAARNKLPGAYPFRSFAISGGLLAYAVDSSELYRHGAAPYVDRILRGAKPGDLPVQAPTMFKLVINLRSAKALGISVPPLLIARADEVIE